MPAGPDYSDSRWRSLRQALGVRNRVTHPKATSDLTITDPELELLEDAWRWFLEASFAVFDEGRLALHARLERAQQAAGPA